MSDGFNNPAERRVLRTAPEPWLAVSDADVHHLLTASPRDYFDHMLQRLGDIAAARTRVEMPPKQVFADDDGLADFRVMPCVTRDGGTVTKTVKLVGTNIAQVRVPDQITVGKALVIDPVENHVTHIIDACLLSSARTGLCAALAIHLLSTGAKNLAVIGSGRVGYYSAFYAAACCGVRDITFSDRRPERAAAAASALAARMPEVNCRSAGIDSADVAILATTSASPPCAPPGWNAGLIISLGADIDHQSELDERWAGLADVYVDTQDSTRFGDLKKWLALGLLQPGSIRQFSDLLAGAGAVAAGGRPKLFVSTGSALFDNLTLEYLLRQLENHPARPGR